VYPKTGTRRTGIVSDVWLSPRQLILQHSSMGRPR